jgi:hypothetical protein
MLHAHVTKARHLAQRFGVSRCIRIVLCTLFDLWHRSSSISSSPFPPPGVPLVPGGNNRLPEYSMPFVIHLLAYHPDFAREDHAILYTFQQYLEFYFDQLCRGHNESYPLLKVRHCEHSCMYSRALLVSAPKTKHMTLLHLAHIMAFS